jgi:hypothetical protein
MSDDIISERVTAAVEGDFVVFLIGMRINSLWKVHRWLPVFLAMPRMLRELEADPDSGLLGYHTNLGIRNQMLFMYWRSFEDLHEYARDQDQKHLPAWQAYNQDVGSDGDVGIWHETFLFRENEYEAVYNNMPPFGLGNIAERVPASGQRETAAERLGRTDGTAMPEAVDGSMSSDS